MYYINNVTVCAVIDTSVLIAGILGPRGASREILLRAMDVEFEWLISKEILKEYQDVFKEKKISNAVQLPTRLRQFINKLLQQLHKKTVTRKIHVVRDRLDDMFVECAVEYYGKYIVSLDKDLLSLKHFGPVKIISPGEFLAILRNEEQ